MKDGKRFAAFLLTAALIVGLLSGCGSTEKEQTTDVPGQEATGLVWTSEFTDLGSAAGYVSSVSFAGGKFYFNTSDYDEEAQRSVEKLWCVDAAAGTMSELTGYAPPAAAQESEDSYSYINSVAAAENGDLLVSETVSMTVFELPEGFSGTEEEKYEYADYVSTDYLRLLDSTGAEKSIVDLTAAAEAVAQKLHLGSVRVSLEARNPFVIASSYKGYFDPETWGNVYTQPLPRTFSCGLDITF